MSIPLNETQQAMLAGEYGVARQMGMRLVLDLAAAAGATELVPIQSAHLSGVSPLTGGLGLRTFLAKLDVDGRAEVAVPTTLNSAGCDAAQFEEMRIVAPDFLDHNQEIVSRYSALGVRPTQSCIPYEWDGVVVEGVAAWAESNAICFGNTYHPMVTNRESGLSALAAALTGYTPLYGLLTDGATQPNIDVQVTTPLTDPADFSILGDWIGKQRRNEWRLPYGPIPVIRGLDAELTHEQRKALTAAAANYGSPKLYVEGITSIPEPFEPVARLTFGKQELQTRYRELQPQGPVSLITLGCPQASVGELRAIAELLKGKRVAEAPGAATPPLWVFTSSANKAIAQQTGIAAIIEESGALLLENTCPEVVPYDRAWVKQILTNSMKAEHYIKSGLNGIRTAVMTLSDCIDVATGRLRIMSSAPKESAPRAKRSHSSAKTQATSATFSANGEGLPSQDDFTITGTAFVSPAPLTFLGFVNRETGVVEEAGHPMDGESLANTIALFPKGSGSSVAPYVLLELFYRGVAPLAIANTDIDQQSAPACSLEGIPYAYGFDADIIAGVNHGDQVELSRRGDQVTLRVLARR